MNESIDVLAERLKTPAWLLAGAKIRLGWVVGTQISEADFVAGLESFKSAPTHVDLSVPEVAESTPVAVITQALKTRQEADDAVLLKQLEAEEAEAKAKLEAEQAAKLEASKTTKSSKGGS
jgi:hypothetical protein